MRLLLEIIENIQSKTDKDYPITCRVSGADLMEPKGYDLEDTKQMARMLEKAGVAEIENAPLAVVELAEQHREADREKRDIGGGQDEQQPGGFTVTTGENRTYRFENDREGRIYWPPRGKYPKLKQYLKESGGKAVGDLWTDIGVVGRTAAERLGYPTQKPEALLERIIEPRPTRATPCWTPSAAAAQRSRSHRG
jgi:hypothetical protein